MSQPRKYKIFIADKDKFKGDEDEVFNEILIDEETREQFQAEIKVSYSPLEGYDRLVLVSPRAAILGECHVKIVKRVEEEEEEVTIFESKRLGDRRGYMLRSMMAEDRDQLKKETMTTELEKRLKRKQEIVQKLLKEKTEDKSG